MHLCILGTKLGGLCVMRCCGVYLPLVCGVEDTTQKVKTTVLQPRFLAPTPILAALLCHNWQEVGDLGKDNVSAHLGDEVASAGIHLRELSESFISHKTDLMTILKMSKNQQQWRRGDISLIQRAWLTGSASMTTSTVAFPGVSRLTRGVRIVCPASFTDCSMAGNWRITYKSIKELSTNWVVITNKGRRTPQCEDRRKQFYQTPLHDPLALQPAQVQAWPKNKEDEQWFSIFKSKFYHQQWLVNMPRPQAPSSVGLNERTKVAILTFWKIVLEFLDTVSKPLCFVKFLNSQKASGLFVLFCGIVEAVELGMNQAVLAMCWSTRTVSPETPCGQVPVLFTACISGFAVQWVRNSTKLTVSRISSMIFQKVRMAAFVHSLAFYPAHVHLVRGWGLGTRLPWDETTYMWTSSNIETSPGCHGNREWL